jgi:hypothetical protein
MCGVPGKMGSGQSHSVYLMSDVPLGVGVGKELASTFGLGCARVFGMSLEPTRPHVGR